MTAPVAGAAAAAGGRGAAAAGARGAGKGAAGGGAAASGGLDLSGSLGQARKGAKKVLGKKKRTSTQRVLIAELLVCLLVVALGPIAKTVSGKDFMKRGSAVLATFMILGLVSSIGPKAGKAAGAFGLLVTLAILVDQKSVFGKLVTIMGAAKTSDESIGPDSPESEVEESPIGGGLASGSEGRWNIVPRWQQL